MVTIAIEKLLSNSTLYTHICLESIKTLYKSDEKWNHQYQYKAIIEAEMVSTPHVLTYKIPMSPIPYMSVKDPSARKTTKSITEVSYVKKKTTLHKLGAAL